MADSNEPPTTAGLPDSPVEESGSIRVLGLPAIPRIVTAADCDVIGIRKDLTSVLPLHFLADASDPNGVAQLGEPGLTGLVVRSLILSAGLASRVAVKIYRESGRQYAQREWRYSNRDLGPRIVRSQALLAVHTDDPERPVMVLVQDLVRGRNLQSLIDARSHLSADALLRVSRGLFEGLVSAEGAGTALRDIKPANVVLNAPDPEDADPVIVDHGGARELAAVTTDPALGTPAYYAPEAFQGDPARVGPSADVFSAAVTILALVHFTPAVFRLPASALPPERDGFSQARGILRGRPNLDDPRLAGRLGEALRGALVKDPMKRATAREVLDVLEGLRVADTAWDPDAPLLPASPPPAPSRPVVDQLPGRPSPVAAEPNRPASEPTVQDGPYVLELSNSKPFGIEDEEEPLGRRGALAAFAGVDSRYVKAPGERILFNSAGLSLLGYTAYALLGVCAFAHFAGLPYWWLALIPGAIVSTLAVALDRGLLGDVHANLDDIDNEQLDDQPLKGWTKGLVSKIVLRIFIAALFAIVVGEPANLLAFNRDIGYQLSTQDQTTYNNDVKNVDAKYSKLTADQNLDAADNQEEAAARAAPGDLTKEAVDAGNGVGGLGVGCGPTSHCLKLRQQAEAAASDLPSILQQHEASKAGRVKEEQTLTADKLADLQKLHAQVFGNTGFLSRETALYKILRNSPAAAVRYVGVVLFLFLIELSCVLAKLFTFGGEYEIAVAQATRRAVRRKTLRGRLLNEQMARRYRVLSDQARRGDEIAAAVSDNEMTVQMAKTTEAHNLRLRRVTLRARRDRARLEVEHAEILARESLVDPGGPSSAI